LKNQNESGDTNQRIDRWQKEPQCLNGWKNTVITEEKTMDEKEAQTEFLLSYICALLKIRQALIIHCNSCGSGCKCNGVLDAKIKEFTEQLSKVIGKKSAEASLKVRDDYVKKCCEKNPELFNKIYNAILDNKMEPKIKKNALTAYDLMKINGLK